MIGSACCLLPVLLAGLLSPDSLPEMVPCVAVRGELLYEATFDDPGDLPPRTTFGKYEIADGCLRVEQREADHHQAAATLYDVGGTTGRKPLQNFILEADFRWDGARNFQIGFNRLPGAAKKTADGKHWEVAPHAFGVAFSQSDDPRQRQRNAWRLDDNSIEPFPNLGTCALELEPGRWYRILIEVKDDEIVVQLSNGQTIRGRGKGASDPKVAPILRCQGREGQGVAFDTIKVWTAR